MKKLIALILSLVCVLSLISCSQQGQQNTANPTQSATTDDSVLIDTKPSTNPDDEFFDYVPYDAMLNLEVMDGKFRFQRIATTPCIVYSNTPITDMLNGTLFNDRDDILTSIFHAMDGKDAIMDVPECDFSHYIYMFDNQREDIPWHYRFDICTCGAVTITNNDELICTIKLADDEIQSILDALQE